MSNAGTKMISALRTNVGADCIRDVWANGVRDASADSIRNPDRRQTNSNITPATGAST